MRLTLPDRAALMAIGARLGWGYLAACLGVPVLALQRAAAGKAMGDEEKRIRRLLSTGEDR